MDNKTRKGNLDPRPYTVLGNFKNQGPFRDCTLSKDHLSGYPEEILTVSPVFNVTPELMAHLQQAL